MRTADGVATCVSAFILCVAAYHGAFAPRPEVPTAVRAIPAVYRAFSLARVRRGIKARDKGADENAHGEQR